MGRNFWQVCHSPCEVKLMHLRGEEKNMHRFSDEHYRHHVEIYDDYYEEPPEYTEKYKDVFDQYYKITSIKDAKEEKK